MIKIERKPLFKGGILQSVIFFSGGVVILKKLKRDIPGTSAHKYFARRTVVCCIM
jgi:hypothetical protein